MAELVGMSPRYGSCKADWWAVSARPMTGRGRSYLRSSMGVFSGLPAKSGRTWTVRRLHGLEALEWTRVSCTLRPIPAGSPPPRSCTSFDVGRAVPLGKTTTPDDEDWPENEGRGEAEGRLMKDDALETAAGRRWELEDECGFREWFVRVVEFPVGVGERGGRGGR